MRVPFFWLALGFVLGILVQPFIRFPHPWLGFLFLAGLPFLWQARGKKIFLILFTLHLFILGIFYADFNLKRSAHAVETWADSARLWLEGVVKTQPDIKTKGKRVIVSFVLSSKNLMRWKEKSHKEFHETKGDVQVFLFNPGLVPDYGDRVRLWGTLEKPKEVLNPGEFDYGKYLTQYQVFSIFKGFGEKSIRRIRTGEGAAFLRLIEKARTMIEQRIDYLFDAPQSLSFNPSSELLKALILGKRKGIPDELRDDFMKTGTSHLLAISGLNITMIAGTFYMMLLVFRVEQKIAAACALVMVMIYVFIAGFGIPVQRAGWMVGSGFLALLLERQRNSLNVFFLAFFILLIFDPGVLKNVSFQLSFISVFSLIWIFRLWPDASVWKDWVGQTVAVMVGTFPLAIYYFNIFSLSSILANFCAIPLFHLAMVNAIVALFLGHVPLLGMGFIQLASFFLSLGLGWIHFLAKAQWGYYFLESPSCLHLGLYYLCLGFFLGLKSIQNRWVPWLRSGVLGMGLILMAAFFWQPGEQAFALTLLAAGKNEIAHFQFSHRNHWLMNTGRFFPSNQGEWLVDPYLRKRGIKHVEGVIMTDLYAKHWGGLPTLIRNFSTESLFYPETVIFPKIAAGEIKKGRINRVPIHQNGKKEMEGGGQIEFLEMADQRMIFRVLYGGKHFLFLPAINSNVLGALDKYRDILFTADVLILPAPEKRNESQSKEFFEKLFQMTDPQAVAMSGEDDSLKSFLKDRDIPLFETAKLGAITFSLKGNSLRVESFRGPLAPAFQ